MKKIIKLHDGIVGSVTLLGVVLGYKVDSRWFMLSGIVAALMISSAFTGFCLVYCVLQKIIGQEI